MELFDVQLLGSCDLITSMLLEKLGWNTEDSVSIEKKHDGVEKKHGEGQQHDSMEKNQGEGYALKKQQGEGQQHDSMEKNQGEGQQHDSMEKNQGEGYALKKQQGVEHSIKENQDEHSIKEYQDEKKGIKHNIRDHLIQNGPVPWIWNIGTDFEESSSSSTMTSDTEDIQESE
jgi:hypothetical protein